MISIPEFEEFEEFDEITMSHWHKAAGEFVDPSAYIEDIKKFISQNFIPKSTLEKFIKEKKIPQSLLNAWGLGYNEALSDLSKLL